MRLLFPFAIMLGLVPFSMPAMAEQSARELMDKSHDRLASESTIKRVDTIEQSMAYLGDAGRTEQTPQTNVVTIEIDRPKHLARQVTTIAGEDLIMLKQGEKTAMKLGRGPWEVPTPRHEFMAKNVGNFDLCETLCPETKENAPVWILVGTEVLDDHEAYVIESEGNTAATLAEQRMAKGITKLPLGGPAQLPTIHVLEYSARHWINKSDFRHLKAVQKSKTQMSVALPDGRTQLIEQSLTATSVYIYGDVSIEVPDGAERILSAGH
jgi:hypothetical protein